MQGTLWSYGIASSFNPLTYFDNRCMGSSFPCASLGWVFISFKWKLVIRFHMMIDYVNYVIDGKQRLRSTLYAYVLDIMRYINNSIISSTSHNYLSTFFQYQNQRYLDLYMGEALVVRFYIDWLSPYPKLNNTQMIASLVEVLPV